MKQKIKGNRTRNYKTTFNNINKNININKHKNKIGKDKWEKKKDTMTKSESNWK